MKRVYFIKPIGMSGPIKVGCSGSPDGRRRALDTWSPFALEIIAEIDGDHDLERRFHALFKPWHERREWFAGAPEVWAIIQQVKCGEFDTASLPPPEIVTANKNASAIQRASWTPERRVHASYSARVRWTQIKTRTVCPRYASMVRDPEAREQIDAYLADPHQHGERLAEFVARTGCLPWWARNLPQDPAPSPTDRPAGKEAA